MPKEWANTQIALGGGYFVQIDGSREQHLQSARGAYELALAVYTREQAPVVWASLQFNIGETYRVAKDGHTARALVQMSAITELL